MTRAVRDEAGFTLLEMLVSLSILALIMLMLGGAVRFATLAWNGSAELQQRTLKQAAALEFLDRTLEEAMPQDAIYPPDGPATFTGTREGFTVIARLPERLQIEGLSRLEFTRDGPGAETALTVRWTPLDRGGNPTDTAPPVETVLLPALADLDFSYRTVPAEGTIGSWVERWDAPQLPRAVRLQYRFEGETQRRDWMSPLRRAMPIGEFQP